MNKTFSASQLMRDLANVDLAIIVAKKAYDDHLQNFEGVSAEFTMVYMHRADELIMLGHERDYILEKLSEVQSDLA